MIKKKFGGGNLLSAIKVKMSSGTSTEADLYLLSSGESYTTSDGLEYGIGA